ncbi:MAG TPA: hypothetical protein VMV00_00565 [Candidatus Baltobacteraceae bacterium]|nr:hypothetical protein [Candidatus Baltobacteraceae bacterium]
MGAWVDRAEMIRELGAISPAVKRSDIVYKHMRDPALLRYYYNVKTMKLLDRMEISGSAPTDIFIGRFGYPKVSIGPLVPPEYGDTSILGMPERWRHMSIEDVVNMRSKLVRGMHTTKVKDVENGRVEQLVRDLALAEKPAETEMNFSKKPSMSMTMMDEVQPFGPSAKISSMDVYNFKADRKMESRYTDTDATARTSMIELYERGVPVSRIQKGLSAGLFGIGQNRKFVPTRWSITAVDDTLGKANLEEVKSYETLDAIHAYYNVSLDNRWLIFLIPGGWQYESIEAWYPKTVWNENGVDISIYGSYEGYTGRKTYAEIGGCYYSGRLAITEKMKMLKKQSMALILREVHYGYIMPVGVWNVREHVRDTLQVKPDILHTVSDMFNYAKARLDIGAKDWIKNSRMLRDLLSQRRIAEYVATG